MEPPADRSVDPPATPGRKVCPEAQPVFLGIIGSRVLPTEKNCPAFISAAVCGTLFGSGCRSSASGGGFDRIALALDRLLRSMPSSPTDFAPELLNESEALEALLTRLESASREDRSPQEFFEQTVRDLVAALSAASGAAWIESDQGLICVAQATTIDPAAERLAPRLEHQWAAAILTCGRPCLLDPGAALPESDVRNESTCVQCLVPKSAAGAPGVVLRVSLRPQASLAARETAGGLLAAVAEIALHFQVQHRLRRLHEQELFWRELDAALRAINAPANVARCAQTIAEQVRRVVHADRVSVLVRRGSRCRLAAISSAAAADRRSRQVRLLERIGTEALRGGGDFEVRVGAGGALRVSETAEAYLDESQLRAVRCDVLNVAGHERPDSFLPAPPDTPGAIVVDSFTGEGVESWGDRLTVLAPHCALALHRSLEIESRGWRMLLAPFRSLSRTALWLLLLAAIAGGAAALVLVPAELRIEAPGRLMPIERRGVYAPADAIVSELLIRDGAAVAAGQPLLRLVAPDLELEWSRLQGELQTAAARLDAVQARRKLKLQDRTIDTSLLSIEEEELKATADGLRRQLDVVRQQRDRLTVASPLAGRAARWDLEQVLQSLPVRHGQLLLDVYNPDGPWRLELDVSDDVSGYVRQAAAHGPPAVDYVLQTDPATIHSGVLESLNAATDLNARKELTVRGIVPVPEGQIAHPRRGATVTARIHCGRRALGFVWFRELIEFVQRRILF